MGKKNNRIFIGKFSKNNPQQITEKFYAGGEKGSSWYNGIDIGDYVFPIFKGEIPGVWRVKGYEKKENNQTKHEYEDVCIFEEIKKYNKPLRIFELNRFKYFDLDMITMNKISKPTASEKKGFFEISLNNKDINILNIDIKSNLRKVYFVLEDKDIELNDRDIIIVIEDKEGYKVKQIKIKINNELKEYKSLMDIYSEKNKENYSLQEKLLINKKIGNRKVQTIEEVINSLDNYGYYEFKQIIKMYDHIFNIDIDVDKTENNYSLYEIYDQIDESKYEDEYIEDETEDYYIDDIIDKKDILEEVFIEEDKIDSILSNLDYKKNIILQGPPGVGKTFVAKKLCYLHQGRKCDDQIEMVQFHQSYSYEDFIRGYRPNKDGGFELKNGIFYKFTKKAINDPNNNYYFIIDEINRGNLSKIFGELMMLIEKDKRGEGYQVSLTYQEDDEKFYIPENLYIIGTMNTADRSLAMVDYALRRRFAFIDIEPAFNNNRLKEYFVQYLGIEMTNKIINKITSLNKVIEKDSFELGKGYRIGHSYFTPTEKINDVESWYKRIIKMEIEPLIREYWFNKAEEELLQKVDDLLED